MGISKSAKSLQTFADNLKKIINPIGGTSLTLLAN